MSGTNEHVLFGAITGFCAYAVAKRLQNEEIDWRRALGCGVMGAGAAILPDILEPANNPRHRALAHSLAVGGTILYTTRKILEGNGLSNEQKATASALVAAYLSHLAADSTTPAGIPLV